MDKVYVVFVAYSEHKRTVFGMEVICSSVETAIDYILSKYDYDDEETYVPVHDSMNEENNYIYVGYRSDCWRKLPYGSGGFIIEEMNVL
jgi:hypothetical protein